MKSICKRKKKEQKKLTIHVQISTVSAIQEHIDIRPSMSKRKRAGPLHKDNNGRWTLLAN